MIKLQLHEQERQMQKWHPVLTAALAPVYLQHYLSRLDYITQLDDFATQLHDISYNPALSEDEKMIRLNTMDQRSIMSVNSAVAHQTYLAVNAILQRTFPDVYAAHAQVASTQTSRSVAVDLGEARQGDGQV